MSAFGPSFWLHLDPNSIGKLSQEDYLVTQKAVHESKQDLYSIIKYAVRDGVIEAMADVGFLKGGGKNG